MHKGNQITTTILDKKTAVLKTSRKVTKGNATENREKEKLIQPADHYYERQ